jgi:site-specific DNA-methyltransferase (adenine-specific)
MESIIYNADCVSGLANVSDNSIDACITDPPYNYEFIGHKWDFNEIQRRITRMFDVRENGTQLRHKLMDT